MRQTHRLSRWQSVRGVLAAIHGWIFAHCTEFVCLTAGLVSLLIGLEFWAHWGDWLRIDWMVVSGLPVGLAFIWATNNVRGRFDDMIDKLSEQKVLRFSEGLDEQGQPKLVEDEARRLPLRRAAEKRIEEDAALWGGGIAFLFVPLCFYVAHQLAADLAEPRRWLFLLVIAAMSLVCALRLGRMVCYGWQGLRYRIRKVVDRQISIRPEIGHPDGHSGLEPIGAFYDYQAGKMMWLIVYLLVWLLVCALWPNPPFIPGGGEGAARVFYLLLTLFAFLFVLQVLGFVVPMWSFRKELDLFRQEQMTVYQASYKQLAEIREELENVGRAERPELPMHALYLRHYCEDVLSMSRWPVAGRTLINFWLGKVATGSVALLAVYSDLADIEFLSTVARALDPH
ncbi:MAG: hypothetical protein OEU09_18740 [Rhodospirillales bacterium]|nr:hypothetical protein [Rhodospirillales bacterium]MDH3791142.1 hypothetical protein [Rhodospirillales bacterium]MDH3913323.1 hypothetical protein [Rhodospirillales bacterium]MDH3918787.1 hypothetical protein [Rhodospirillales bacterium]MDH3966907.1 hypothetical protein [Rhodospirillales bacterium]